MATPPKGPTGTTPPRRKAAARKPARTSSATTKAPKPPKHAEDTALDVEVTPPKSAGTAAPPKAKAPTKPRAPAKPRPAAKLSATQSKVTAAARRQAGDEDSVSHSTAPRSTASRRDQSSNRNFLAAALGGVAALGAAAAGVLYAVKAGKSAKPSDATPNQGAIAHQPDGTDSSASFEAGIADEGTIPENA